MGGSRKARGIFFVTTPILLVIFAYKSCVRVYLHKKTHIIQCDIDARDWTEFML